MRLFQLLDGAGTVAHKLEVSVICSRGPSLETLRLDGAGAEFDGMTPHAQANAVSQLVVFSRVEPSHKTRLVEVLKSQVPISLKNKNHTLPWDKFSRNLA